MFPALRDVFTDFLARSVQELWLIKLGGSISGPCRTLDLCKECFLMPESNLQNPPSENFFFECRLEDLLRLLRLLPDL